HHPDHEGDLEIEKGGPQCRGVPRLPETAAAHRSSRPSNSETNAKKPPRLGSRRRPDRAATLPRNFIVSRKETCRPALARSCPAERSVSDSPRSRQAASCSATQIAVHGRRER